MIYYCNQVKKATAIFLAFYYLIVSIGLTANIHICGGKIDSFTFFPSSDSHGACCGGKPMKKDCCKDKKIVVKKTSKEIPTSKICFSPVVVADVETTLFYICPKTELHFSDKTVLVSNHSPPPDAKHPIYLRNHAFLV